jgi:hypothetical protein
MRAQLTLRMVVVLVMSTAFGCADFGDGGESETYGLREQVPFTANDVGSFTLTEGGVCGEGFLEVDSTATGTGTVLGRYTWRTVECFDPVAGTFEGTFTITTADGAKVTGSYTGVITGFIDDCTATYEQTATISGGTGRFTGASGSFVSEGTANLCTLGQTQSHSGTISNPGTL